MSPTKRFLLGFFGFALAGWITGIVLFGSPGFSSKYLAQHHHDHEHYIEITKSDLYKRYLERPALNGPDRLDAHHAALLRGYIPFVEEYESRPAFQAEVHRIENLELYFEFFNPLLVILLVWRFGRKPLAGFLDAQIAALRERMDAAAAARIAAAARLEEANARVASLTEEQARVQADTAARLERELAELEAANKASLASMERELEERKQAELNRATQQLKKELVDAAMADVVRDLQAQRSPRNEERLLEAFLAGLERRA